MSHNAKSIYVLTPLETGGVQNRSGIGFQDHIAAEFCLDMLLDGGPVEVWCENQDDITLIWNPQIKVEFVQVKSSELDQLWTIALLCNREGKGEGHSILEKSLAYDRCEEPCCFRIVTCRPVQDELKILTYDLDSPYRLQAVEALNTLCSALKGKVGTFKSENGNNCEFWAKNATWDVRHSEEAIKNKAVLKIRRILEKQSTFLAEDQIEEVYSRILRKVWDAGVADHRFDLKAKRITKAEFLAWFTKAVDVVLHPASVSGGKKMQEKMEYAGIAADTIKTALEERRYYREEVLSPQYLSIVDRGLMEREVLAALQQLKSKLDTGAFTDSGPDFHEKCLAKLEVVQHSLQLASKPPLVFLHGYMYNVVDRCLHRFRRATA
jgi:hypothetical protein